MDPLEVYRAAYQDPQLETHRGIRKANKDRIRQILERFPSVAAISEWKFLNDYYYRLHNHERAITLGYLVQDGIPRMKPMQLTNVYFRDKPAQKVGARLTKPKEDVHNDPNDMDVDMLEDLL